MDKTTCSNVFNFGFFVSCIISVNLKSQEKNLDMNQLQLKYFSCNINDALTDIISIKHILSSML